MVLRRYMGAPVKRREDPRLITGSSVYVDDLQLTGMVHVAFVRSIYAHANIKGVDTSEAETMPGVVAILTARDLEQALPSKYQATGGDSGPAAEGGPAEPGKIPVPSVEPLARAKVRYIGEPIVAVLAETRAQADDAAELVVVDYEPLETYVDPFEARADGAARIYDTNPNNVGVRYETVHGDVDAALASSPIRIKERIKAARCHPLPLEPRGIVASPDPITRGVTIWVSNQGPHGYRNEVARTFGLGQNQVRVIAPEVGGGFGAKFGVYPEDWTIIAAAMKLNRPVKWIETRSEAFLSTNHGRNQIADFEAACDENGKITALRARVTLDLGAYPKGLGLAWSTWVMSTGPYNIPNLDYVVEGVFTNTMANGAYRGAGRPEAAFYLERVMDLLADAGNFPPEQLRRVNFLQPEQFPYKTLSGERYDTGEYEKSLNHALESSAYADLRKEQEELRKQGRYLGIGLGSYVEICGFGPWESSTVRVEPGGEVTLFTGISPHGQGQETTFAQMAADMIGADFEKVILHHGDTGNTPQGNGTGGSRGLAVGGAALVISLNKIKEKAIQIAANNLEASVDDIELVDGKYQVKGVPSRGLTLPEISKIAYGGKLPGDMESGLETTNFFSPEDETFPFGTHIAVVEVFPETGELELIKYLSVDDIGNIISPMLVAGQVHGGLAQGIGLALWEEVQYDSNGELLTGTLNDYALPKADGFPMFETLHTTTTTPINPLGAKGIGEASTIGATPTASNAVIDALEPWGITHLDLPFTPEKIWRAISEAESKQKTA
ncbi:MAG TPA: xanthine dehydrogenase family protein molybdopterin-binding subunit [Thermomicrobiales bacterium]|nr:xanthine dehydrogenase family protein molybdopterin-binding subunit [Thermomicrobiales bacterium]